MRTGSGHADGGKARWGPQVLVPPFVLIPSSAPLLTHVVTSCLMSLIKFSYP